MVDDLIEGVSGGMAFHEDVVGNGGVELTEGGDVDRAAHEVGEDADEGGLGDGGLFSLHWVKPPAEGEVGADEADDLAVDEVFELEDIVEAFAGGHGQWYRFGDVFHRLQAFGGERVFVVEDTEGLQLAGEEDGLFGAQVAVDFEAEIDVEADGIAHGCDHGDGLANHLGGRLAFEGGQEGGHAKGKVAG